MLFSSLTHTLATLNSNQELKQINHSTNTRGVNHTHMYLWNYKHIAKGFHELNLKREVVSQI